MKTRIIIGIITFLGIIFNGTGYVALAGNDGNTANYKIYDSLSDESAESKDGKHTDSHIVGDVVNADTGEHLPYIDVYLEGTMIATITDATGHFFMKNLPVGKYVLKASSLGYVPQSIDVDIQKGKTIELRFSLKEDVAMLEASVVTANKNTTNRKETSTIVNLITPKKFELVSSVCLADGLNFQPGLRVETNCQNCGNPQLRMNGLEGHYTQILIDSRSINSALAGVYNLEQLPVNMIERVEIVRGGGSALFGANAIAGTVNIITKEPTYNSFQVSNTTNVIGMKSFDNTTNINGAIVSDNQRIGASIFASTRERQAYDHDGDGFSEIGKLSSKNLGTKAYFRTSYNTKLTLEYHTLYEYRRGGDSLNKPPHEANIAEMTEHYINTGSAKFDWFLKDKKHWLQFYTSVQNINRESYYGTNMDPNAYGYCSDLANVNGIQYVLNMDKCLFMPATLTAGVEHNYSALHDVILGKDRDTTQKINIASVFVQNEWKNKYLTMLLGLRMDYHSQLSKPVFSPRVNFRYTPASWVALRLGYGMGFRAPQIYDEDLHIEAVQGTVSNVVNAKNLRQETSHSVNLSADFNTSWKNGGMTFLAEGFFTHLDDVFFLEKIGVNSQGILIQERRNGAGAMVAGMNLEFQVRPIRSLDIQGGFTFQKSMYKEAEQWSDEVKATRRMFRTPDTYGFLTFLYTPLERLDLSLSGVYTGEMLVQHNKGGIGPDGNEILHDSNVITPSFFDLNFKISYDVKLTSTAYLKFDLGVKNILNSYQKDFDRGPGRDAGYVYGPTMPRSLFFGASFRF